MKTRKQLQRDLETTEAKLELANALLAVAAEQAKAFAAHDRELHERIAALEGPTHEGPTRGGQYL